MADQKHTQFDRKILRNSAKCLACGDEIESKHRHDFVSCSCGNVSVDGGKEYIRRGIVNLHDYEDTSQFDVCDILKFAQVRHVTAGWQGKPMKLVDGWLYVDTGDPTYQMSPREEWEACE